MAITGAQLQTALGVGSTDAKVTQEFGVVATFQDWYVEGNLDAPGRAKLVTTTAADNAATQAASVLTQLSAN
jgi:hypothetical protein